MKRFIVLIAALLLFELTSKASAGSWLFYHKPAFDGQIIDIDSKEPIEGAVVEVEYQKILYGIMGHDYETFQIKETLTDKEGKFHFPSYTTLINPFSIEAKARFIIYKPGYAPGGGLEEDFSKNGRKDQEGDWYQNKNKKFKYHNKILEIPRLESKEDRKAASFSVPFESYEDVFKKQKLLRQKYDEEEKYLGFKPSTKPSIIPLAGSVQTIPIPQSPEMRKPAIPCLHLDNSIPSGTSKKYKNLCNSSSSGSQP